MSTDRIILESAAGELRARGFDVYREPLPDFLADEAPDAVAFRGSDKFAVAIAGEDAASRARLDRLRERVAAQSEWKLVVYSVVGTDPNRAIGVVSKASVEKGISDVYQLMTLGQSKAALLLAWAALEALGRLNLPDSLTRPQTPASLLEALASEGIVDPDDADRLRRMGVLRDRVMHGGLDSVPDTGDLARFILVLKLGLDRARS